MTTQFSGKVFTFVQPDGTEIQVKGWGNQNYAVFETLDGYTLTKNPRTGFYEVAQLSPDGNQLESAVSAPGDLDGGGAGVPRGLRITPESARAKGTEGFMRTMAQRRCEVRRQRRRNLAEAARAVGAPLAAPPSRGTVGDYVGLCILIDFVDEPATISRDEVERFCNEVGYSGFGNKGSVRDYFFANSIGRCRYTNSVTSYYRAAQPKTYYTDPDIEDGVRARELIGEALRHLVATGFDFSPLTVDDEGYVYAMNVYYTGPVVNRWSEGLWPHAWSLAAPFVVEPGRQLYDYQFTAMGHELTLGTFCHENGHMLCDYPDLYDYGGQSSGVGLYCLMCAGNFDEKNPTNISAYLKRLSGWSNRVLNVEHETELELAAGTNDFAIHSRNETEYFIIESRQRDGRDTSLPDEGLAIWHVDELGSNNDEQMSATQHYELSLEQADAEFSLERSASHLGDSSDLYDQAGAEFSNSTMPNSKWWDGTASNLSVSILSIAGGAVSFRTMLSSGGQTIHGESLAPKEIPDNTPAGVIDSITILETAVIASARVSLHITHTYIGDLRLTLIAPWGDQIRLRDRQGGGANDIQVTLDESDVPALTALRAHSTFGAWLLHVQDAAPVDVGTLQSWSLEFLTVAENGGSVVLEDSSGIHIPDSDPNGITGSVSTTSTGSVGEIEVSVDITHPYSGDLRIALTSPEGTEVILRDQLGAGTDNVVETYTTATTPSLETVVGESVAGSWRLKVADLLGQDVGKLNSWGMRITPVPET